MDEVIENIWEWEIRQNKNKGSGWEGGKDREQKTEGFLKERGGNVKAGENPNIGT